MAVELAKKKLALNAEKELIEIDLSIKKEEEQRKLLAARFETSLKATEDSLKLAQLEKE